jgi:hypothetical protein
MSEDWEKAAAAWSERVAEWSIEDIQRHHVRTERGHDMTEVCNHDGLAWPCHVARVFMAWDKDGERQIRVTKETYRDVASRLVRDLTKGANLKRKADHPASSYDPLVRESAVLGILAALCEPSR